MPALPLDEAGKYVAGAYVVFLALLLIYLAIMSARLQRIDRELAELAEVVRRGRLYAGYSGWGPGQLEAELAEEAWIVEAPLRDELFSDDPEGLWAAVLRRMGREFALLSTMPPDPSLN